MEGLCLWLFCMQILSHLSLSQLRSFLLSLLCSYVPYYLLASLLSFPSNSLLSPILLFPCSSILTPSSSLWFPQLISPLFILTHLSLHPSLLSLAVPLSFSNSSHLKPATDKNNKKKGTEKETNWEESNNWIELNWKKECFNWGKELIETEWNWWEWKRKKRKSLRRRAVYIWQMYNLKGLNGLMMVMFAQIYSHSHQRLFPKAHKFTWTWILKEDLIKTMKQMRKYVRKCWDVSTCWNVETLALYTPCIDLCLGWSDHEWTTLVHQFALALYMLENSYIISVGNTKCVVVEE